jgi:hypothetical protein
MTGEAGLITLFYNKKIYSMNILTGGVLMIKTRVCPSIPGYKKARMFLHPGFLLQLNAIFKTQL